MFIKTARQQENTQTETSCVASMCLSDEGGGLRFGLYTDLVIPSLLISHSSLLLPE
jgi:hypothetical protein